MPAFSKVADLAGLLIVHSRLVRRAFIDRLRERNPIPEPFSSRPPHRLDRSKGSGSMPDRAPSGLLRYRRPLPGSRPDGIGTSLRECRDAGACARRAGRPCRHLAHERIAHLGHDALPLTRCAAIGWPPRCRLLGMPRTLQAASLRPLALRPL